MQAKWTIPMIDFVFLSLGALAAVVTQMEVFKSIPLDLAEADAEAASQVAPESVDVVTVTADAVLVNGEAVTLEELAGRLTEAEVVVRAERTATVERLVPVLAALRTGRPGSAVRLQFNPVSVGVGGAGR